MAVGDIVSQISAVGAVLTFQPAGTNVICVTCWFLDDTAAGIALYDGALHTYMYGTAGGTTRSPITNTRTFLNNTNYLNIDLAAAKSTGFCGIQIQ